jgi:hypothetical protein
MTLCRWCNILAIHDSSVDVLRHDQTGERGMQPEHMLIKGLLRVVGYQLLQGDKICDPILLRAKPLRCFK